MTISLDLILYCTLLVLFIWRVLSPWRCCGQWYAGVNYVSALYVLLSALFIAQLVNLIRAAIADLGSRTKDGNTWINWLVFATPVAMCAMLVMAWLQTRGHIEKIRAKKYQVQHDRAVNIIALPPVYGILSMSAMVQVYWLDVHARAGEMDSHSMEVQFARFDTCFSVADLYESWALYQFGKLTIEVIEAEMQRKSSRLGSEAAGDAVIRLFETMSSLMWTGTYMFLLVCVAQSGWSLWQWTVGGAADDFTSYEAGLGKFGYASLLASCAAIYNVQLVEHSFSEELTDYAGLLKFISVKLMVFFSFWQFMILDTLREKEFLTLDKTTVQLLHCTLMIYECLVAALLHYLAWGAEEDWYNKAKVEDDERKPLLASPLGGPPPSLLPQP